MRSIFSVNQRVFTVIDSLNSDPNAIVEVGAVDRTAITQFINAAQKILHPAFDVSRVLSKLDLENEKKLLPNQISYRFKGCNQQQRHRIGKTCRPSHVHRKCKPSSSAQPTTSVDDF